MNSPVTDDMEDAAAEPVDVVLTGTVFWDLVMTGLPRIPANGEEIRADRMATAPGGVANLAVAASRLGVFTSLATTFGADMAGRFCSSMLAAEGIDLGSSRVCEGWTTPVTVSVTHAGDRRMFTHQSPAPVSTDDLLAGVRPPRAALVDLDQLHSGQGASWTRAAADAGTAVIADIGFDETGRWDRGVLDELAWCRAFLPNAVEAMGLTRRDSPREAARDLADTVPVVVVTDGLSGAWAVDAGSGEECHVGAIPVPADQVVDATGAGDVFDAAFTWATLSGWPLGQRLDLASLASSLAVRGLTGSMAAPGWAEIGAWWQGLGDSSDDQAMRRRFGFLADCALDAPAVAPAPLTIGWDL
ncbi:carbohydrate kinase family protein [Acidipropionibacterium jensenii]|uniref:carbohydrate kinase family protein n=1 Tax=Acidipropionibacterium jensenii TaxID=1749 RepID=UPI00110BB95D|nr:PfkB family carbohydrate kinase [Acidipropionibacterium jensenii]QCV87618.1 carbohydrate kinase family protein [Acidipropionibacterium jensenii]